METACDLMQQPKALKMRYGLIVIPGPASLELGRRVADLLDARIVPVELKRFPDGESRLRFDGSVEREEVLIVQSTGPPQNENLVHLLLMADNARDMGADSIVVAAPYLAYARQDKRFRPGEAFSVSTVVKLLQACGVSEVITVNSHNPAVLGQLGLPVQDLSATGLLAEHFKQLGLKDVFCLSLGKKGLTMAVEANNVLKGQCDYIPTQRDHLTGNVTIESRHVPVKDRDVVIFDDVISSGGTMVKAVEWAKQQEPRRIYVACVHPLLIGDAMERILRSGANSVVGTDTVPSTVSVVSVAPLIADAVRRSKAD
jgi:ribose-phosphate pyrophosphokinase